MGATDEAKKMIDADRKVYTTSDNSLYVVKRDRDISGIIKHCSENNLTLFDVEENKEIEIKSKASKKNERSAES